MTLGNSPLCTSASLLDELCQERLMVGRDPQLVALIFSEEEIRLEAGLAGVREEDLTPRFVRFVLDRIREDDELMDQFTTACRKHCLAAFRRLR